VKKVYLYLSLEDESEQVKHILEVKRVKVDIGQSVDNSDNKVWKNNLMKKSDVSLKISNKTFKCTKRKYRDFSYGGLRRIKWAR